MISLGKGTRIKKSVLSKELIKTHEINLVGRGKSIQMLELTEKGYRSIGADPRKGIGRGANFIHGFWQHYINQLLYDKIRVHRILAHYQ